jgi:hypothetical protein
MSHCLIECDSSPSMNHSEPSRWRLDRVSAPITQKARKPVPLAVLIAAHVICWAKRILKRLDQARSTGPDSFAS